MLNESPLMQLRSTGVISDLDLQLGRLLGRMSPVFDMETALAAALLSSAVMRGHICLYLAELTEELRRAGTPMEGIPEPGLWAERLYAGGVVGRPGEAFPVILDGKGRLYLYRYWEYERLVVEGISRRLSHPLPIRRPDLLRGQLDRLFPSETRGGVDWQKAVALAALRSAFCVISGGPGTGKTTTVARILALLLEQAEPEPLRIALAAPTGKAAARLEEAIGSVRGHLSCREEVQRLIPDKASTIHRLLGPVQGSPFFRHNRENPLPLDVMVVDEASMVDLPLLSKLIQALPESSRLILIGDQDQLASVEAGSVLGDICHSGRPVWFSRDFAEGCSEFCSFSLGTDKVASAPSQRTRDCVIRLTRNYRFGEASGIARLADAVREGRGADALEVLKGGRYPDVCWRDAPTGELFRAAVQSEVLEGYRDYLQAVAGCLHSTEELPGIFKFFERFRILCAVREGPFGVAALNDLAEDILQEVTGIAGDRTWYVGRPVLIVRNDYPLRLFNGDVGVTLPDPASRSGPRVFFPGPEGKFRDFHPLRLPEHETVFAMTVHKSQGSEFGRVLLVLPDRESPVLTRELIYTAVTRTRERLSIWGSEGAFLTAVNRSTRRRSGISDGLWGE